MPTKLVLSFAVMTACNSAPPPNPPVTVAEQNSGWQSSEVATQSYNNNQNWHGSNSSLRDDATKADILVTVNGNSTPQIQIQSNQLNTLSFEARSINFPSRRLVVHSIIMQPQPANANANIPYNSRAELSFSLGSYDASSGVIRVLVRDMSRCEQAGLSSTRCDQFSQTRGNFDEEASFNWVMSGAGNFAQRQNSGSALLGAGIGALAGLVSSGSVAGAFNGALSGALLGMIGPQSMYSGGASYGLGYGSNTWNSTGSNYGQYPGYGYSGLSNGNLYGGYYGGAGTGYGSSSYSGYQYNPNGWSNGITNNPYYSVGSSSYFQNNNINRSSSYHDHMGSSGYYRGYGTYNTIGSRYDYLGSSLRSNQQDDYYDSYDRYSSTGYGLTGTENDSEVLWLAH